MKCPIPNLKGGLGGTMKLQGREKKRKALRKKLGAQKKKGVSEGEVFNHRAVEAAKETKGSKNIRPCLQGHAVGKKAFLIID